MSGAGGSGRDDLTLVAGATGVVGTGICAALARDGRRVRALVRPTADAAKVGRLRGLGVEVVDGDLERPATLRAALEGVSGVVTTASAFPVDPRPDAIERVDRVGSLNLVEAAATAGVRRFVYTSFREIPVDFAFQRAKRAVEERLGSSGLEYTILRPINFMEVWFSPMLGFDAAGGRVRVYGDGAAPLQWISSGDVVEFAVWALEAEAAACAKLDLGGPEALSQLDVIAIFEELVGKPLAREHLPLAELERQYTEAPGPLEQSLASVMLEVAYGGRIETADLAAAAGIRLATVREVAERLLAAAG